MKLKLKKREELSTPESDLDCIARGNRNILTDGNQNLHGQVAGHQIRKVSSLSGKGPAGKTEVLEPSDKGRMSLMLPELAESIMFCSHFTEVKLIKERESERTQQT